MRIAVTIVETAPGSNQFQYVGEPGTPAEHKDALKELPAGDQKAFVLSTSGVEKRRRVSLSKAAKKKAAKKSA
jgi:hypothetical protein